MMAPVESVISRVTKVPALRSTVLRAGGEKVSTSPVADAATCNADPYQLVDCPVKVPICSRGLPLGSLPGMAATAREQHKQGHSEG